MPEFLSLPGQPALSAFRQERLLERLRAVHPAISALDADFIHLVWSDRALDGDETARLKALLEGHAQPQADGRRLWDPAPSHQEIAQLLGCTRPMVSRGMKDLELGHYVQIGRRSVVLLGELPAQW